ncbi:hypothetical protein BC834DRAFT_870398 [Gloeopeniophorella convolvens]|nr:hypothetical protein BC834DRAFT_870398 [Gloeopeniophorella convolvens]
MPREATVPPHGSAAAGTVSTWCGRASRDARRSDGGRAFASRIMFAGSGLPAAAGQMAVRGDGGRLMIGCARLILGGPS